MIFRPIIFIIFAILTSSCAVLTQSQVKMVENLAISSDTLTRSPAMIFRGLSSVRTGRGLLYAHSLQSPQAHFDEVAGIATASVKSDATIKKAETYVTVLNSYTRALRSIANKARWQSIGTELRGLGSKTDSIFMALNDTKWLDDEIPEGFARLSGRYSALITENYMKGRQARAIREYVTSADTLVGQCTARLMEILKGEELSALIANEHRSLASDYRAYLDARALQNLPYSIEVDERYLSLYESMSAVDDIRRHCVIALRAFATAHHKLSANLQKRSKESQREQLQDITESIISLNTWSFQLSELIRKLDRTK